MRSPIRLVCHRLLGGLQDSVSGSISSPSDLLNHKVLIKTVQVQQLAIKILIDSGVGFKDSKGKNKAILTILLEIMYSV